LAPITKVLNRHDAKKGLKWEAVLAALGDGLAV
jgi:hypothetical protein